MKVSINWLKDLVDVDVSTKELAAKFNLHSAEVENFYKLVEASNVVVGYVTKKEKHPNAKLKRNDSCFEGSFDIA